MRRLFYSSGGAMSLNRAYQVLAKNGVYIFILNFRRKENAIHFGTILKCP